MLIFIALQLSGNVGHVPLVGIRMQVSVCVVYLVNGRMGLRRCICCILVSWGGGCSNWHLYNLILIRSMVYYDTVIGRVRVVGWAY